MRLCQLRERLLPSRLACVKNFGPIEIGLINLGAFARQPSAHGRIPRGDVQDHFPDAMRARRPRSSTFSIDVSQQLAQRRAMPSGAGKGATQLICDPLGLFHVVTSKNNNEHDALPHHARYYAANEKRIHLRALCDESVCAVSTSRTNSVR